MIERMSIEEEATATAPSAEHLSMHPHRSSVAAVAMTTPKRLAEADTEESKLSVELGRDHAFTVENDQLETGNDPHKELPTIDSATNSPAGRNGSEA